MLLTSAIRLIDFATAFAVTDATPLTNVTVRSSAMFVGSDLEVLVMGIPSEVLLCLGNDKVEWKKLAD